MVHPFSFQCYPVLSTGCAIFALQSLSRVRLFATPWTAAHQASLSFLISWSLLKLMSIESVMPSNHLILSSPSPPASVFPSITAFSSESVLCFRWPKYWSFSFSISPSNEHSGLISFRIDLLDLLTVQETPKSSPAPQFLCINFLVLSLFYCPALMSIHNYCKNHSFDYMDLCRQSSTIYFQIIFLEWRWSLKNWTWPSDTTSHFSVLMSQNSRKTMHVHTGLCNVHIRNYFMVFMNTINKNSPSLLKWVLWKSN